MNVRRFIAGNARDALRKVKETLGNDAIILSNRAAAGGGVEIMAVASRDMGMLMSPPQQAQRPVEPPVPTVGRHQIPVRDIVRTSPAPVPAANIADDDEGADYRVAIHSARRAAAPARPQAPVAPARPTPAPAVNASMPRPASLRAPTPPVARPMAKPTQAPAPRAQAAAPIMPHPVAEPAIVQPVSHAQPQGQALLPAEVMDEIRSLRKIVEHQLAGFAWGESNRSAPGKTQALQLMLDAGFSPRFTRDLLADLPTGISPTDATTWVKHAADRSLLTMGTENDIVDRGGVFALVGPTGVGKTTTTAKLAARCVLRHGANSLALITTDGYRIGAHEQLKIYGRILGVSVHLVKNAVELQQTLHELKFRHMVLIDTMGMSQKDKLVPELTDMLAGCAVERLLLLNSTARGDTLDDVVRAYAGAGLSGCVLTKVDEAASLATALDVVMRHRLKVHYVANGQRVPEDIHVPNRAYLLHRAFKELPETSPHKYSGMEPAMMMAEASYG